VRLEQAAIPTARLDCLVLLEDALQKNRAHLLAEPDEILSSEQISLLEKQLERREQHIPLAYIREKCEFYGREFKINEHVLQPRPESETMIDLLKQLQLPSNTFVADIGSGSGALAITAVLELGLSKVYMHDIDPQTLEVAMENARVHNVTAVPLQTNLLAGAKENYDVLLCNLPYVPDSFQINTAASHEPAIALFGGSDGLDLYRTMFEQINTLPHKPQFILTESLPPSQTVLKEIAAKASYRQLLHKDFIQVFST
jgi:release factor glutamine methyltransferase